MDNFNTKLHTLKSDLVNTIRDSEIPVGAVYYLLKDLFNEVSESYQQSLVIEQQINSLTNDEIKEDTNE